MPKKKAATAHQSLKVNTSKIVNDEAVKLKATQKILTPKKEGTPATCVQTNDAIQFLIGFSYHAHIFFLERKLYFNPLSASHRFTF